MKKKHKALPKLDGRKAKSLFEVEVYEEAKRNAKDVKYESEWFDYISKHRYNPDIVMTTKSGKRIYIEVKGNGRSFDSTVRAKMVAMKKQHPDIDIRFIFYRDGKVGRRKKDGTFTKQSDWAARHDFPFGIKTIPPEWYEE